MGRDGKTGQRFVSWVWVEKPPLLGKICFAMSQPGRCCGVMKSTIKTKQSVGWLQIWSFSLLALKTNLKSWPVGRPLSQVYQSSLRRDTKLPSFTFVITYIMPLTDYRNRFSVLPPPVGWRLTGGYGRMLEDGEGTPSKCRVGRISK